MNTLIPIMQEGNQSLCTVMLILVCALVGCVVALIIGDTKLPLK